MSIPIPDHADAVDAVSEGFLVRLAHEEKVKSACFPGVRTVLVIFSATGIVFDQVSLQQKIRAAYPGALVFFRTTAGHPVGKTVSGQVDLLIDLTGPGAHQGFFFARKLRRLARISIGRNAGIFRKRIYTKVVDEKSRMATLPKDSLARERVIQREVLAAAGIALEQTGEVPADQGKTIAIHLPPLTKL